MVATPMTDDDRVDDHVNEDIIACLDIRQPRSFFLFAGAGSGKTRALVTALNRLRELHGKHMRLHGQQVAVITYTNAACDEINRRLEFDPLVLVVTIHSFIWEMIQGFNTDIRNWLQKNLPIDIAELQDEQRRGRPGTQASADRERSIEAKQKRLAVLATIKRFIYSPTGDNRTRDSLSHAEVIKMGAAFLSQKPLMQKLLISRFPIMLVDESQDTNKLLMDALFAVQAVYRDRFRLGLFGDTMQRIYSDGKVDLGRNLPSDWATPAMVMNHRCPKRVIRLINKIRSAVDDQEQRPRSDAIEGHVRLFISQSDTIDKNKIEAEARKKMALATGDALWNQPEQVKTLTLEHHMAAKRLNFLEIFEPLYKNADFKTGLLDGTLPAIRFFSELILPLVTAQRDGNKFAAAAVVRKASPLLGKGALEASNPDQLGQLKAANAAVEALMDLWSGGAHPQLIEVLQCIAASNLFAVPDTLKPFAQTDAESSTAVQETDDAISTAADYAKALESIRGFLNAPFSQVEPYAAYVRGEAAFGTHQGVKGLEFPRVCVVMDDEEARGFLFSYEKLLGAKAKTRADLQHEQAGEETGIDKTRRLFYVTCSRSQSSLAIIAYTADPAKVRQYAIQQGWFAAEEIELIP